MSKSVLANKVGKTLFTVAKEKNSEQEVLLDLKIATQVALNDTNFITLMNNPNILKEKKCSLIDKSFVNVNKYVVNTLKILVENLQILLLKEVEEAYIDIYNKFTKNVVVNVESVYELTNEEKEKLAKNLKEKLKVENIEIKNTIDKTLLGGLKISYEGQVIDASIKKRLLDIERKLSVV